MASKMSLLLPLLFFLVLSSVKCKLDNAQTTSGFEFIKDLQGYEKGSKAQGLHDLKLYLARFGYLNYQPTPNQENHHFDQELEKALKSYQNFFNLNATGTLDEATVSQMVKPRCGEPDIKGNHQHNTKLPVNFTSLYQFYSCDHRWPASKTSLTYAFSSGYPNEYIPPVVRAFSTWASASNYFTFSRVDDFEAADLKIAMASRDHGDGYPFDGPSGVLAHAFSPTDGRFHYDADEKWSAGPGVPLPSAYDLETVGLHEIGHLLGLAHSQDQNAIMWPSTAPGSVKGLSSDDIQGLKVLYGRTYCIEEVSPATTP